MLQVLEQVCVASVGVVFFGVGVSLPLSEKILPDRYPPLSSAKMVRELFASPSLDQPDFNFACLQKLADDGILSFVQGRALYPRYYRAGDGESITDKIGYKKVDEGRLVFNIVGQANRRVIFPMTQPPRFFPHASDITLMFSKDGELWFVYVKQGEKDRFYVSESFDLSICQ